MNRIKVVLRAETMGFCMGVRKAVDIVNSLIVNNKEGSITTLGPLIHNKQVLDRFEDKGVYAAEEYSSVEGTAVIRAHGITPGLRQKLLGSGINLVDATCPRVLRSQKIVTEHSLNGYHIVLVGDKDHVEVTAIAACAESCDIIQTVKQADTLVLPDKTLVIAQTTVEEDEYNVICNILSNKAPGLKIIKSICPATRARQNSLKELIKKVDALLIIGSKTSANTCRLFSTARTSGKPSWLLENENEIPDAVYQYEKIGISAGASTPDWVIKDVENKLIQRRV